MAESSEEELEAARQVARREGRAVEPEPPINGHGGALAAPARPVCECGKDKQPIGIAIQCRFCHGWRP